ncbi:MAG: hypothetical protein COB94_007290 [Gammaproteobacteria bacterium]|nr:hypothetical protein [Gammaproteobacteria bacterium]
MKNTMKSVALASVAAVALTAGSAFAAKPIVGAEAAEQFDALMATVATGDSIWHTPQGSNGLACANCHPDGSAIQPETFPKAHRTLGGRVVALRDMIQWCLQAVTAADGFDYASDEMIAMETYATYTNRGAVIDLGKDVQTGAVPVISGPGYPGTTH